jgi:hypothetical protein
MAGLSDLLPREECRDLAAGEQDRERAIAGKGRRALAERIVVHDQPEKTGMEVGSSSNSPESTAQSQQRHPRNCGATPGTRFEAKLLDPPTRIQEKARLLMMPTKVEWMPLSEYSRLL